MLILFPVPGYIAKMVQDVQVQRMKMVLVASSVSVPHPTDIHLKFKMDARVQDVTEGTPYTMITPRCRCLSIIFTAVNVLRMIKLFGWEGRMSERIREKRNIELGWLWKLRVGRIILSVCLPCH